MIQVRPMTCPHPVAIPPLIPVRQVFPEPRESEIGAAVARELARLPGLQTSISGRRIALTAGSRGIARIDEILAATIAELQARGAEPFIVPAMGSHGGATAAGQTAMLAQLGITEERMRAPILASMETVVLGQLDDGTPVYMDRYAAEADGILLINRIKPHTSFSGPIESGLAKMCAIGLGKRAGAEAMHSAGPSGLRERITPAARLAIAARPVLGGLAILENPHEDVAAIVGLSADQIGGDAEAQLLEQARELRPMLPFSAADLLIVEMLGKDISGTGMDTGVIGRMHISGQPEPARPRIGCIVVLSLSPASRGNAVGIGLADVVTARLAEQVDWRTTWTNSITSGMLGPGRARLPMVAASEIDAIQLGLLMCGAPVPSQARVAYITSTKHLAELHVSATLLEAADRPLERLGEPAPLSFEHLWS